MQAKAQDEHLTDLRNQFPFERMTCVRGGHTQRDQLPLLEQIQRWGRKCSHVADHSKDHGAQIFEQIDITQHPTMRFTCTKIDEMTIQFEDNGTIAGDEADLTQPRFQQATLRRGGKEVDGNLQAREKNIIKKLFRWDCNSPMHKVKQCQAIWSPARSTCLMRWPRQSRKISRWVYGLD